MSKLEYYSRPLVAFDPKNKQHRRYFFEYIQRRAWGRCPVRFIVPEDHGNLIDLIQSSLIKFYVEKEFGKIEA